MTHEEVGKWLDLMKSGEFTQIQGRYIHYIHEYCALGLFRYFVCKGAVDFWDIAPPKTVCQLITTLNDTGEIDQYKRVIKDVEEGLESYITN